MKGVLKDETGRRFGRLVVLERVENGPTGNARWRCLCDCGGEVIVIAPRLRSGATKSCGCWAREVSAANGRRNISHAIQALVKHGHCRVGKRTYWYEAWAGQKQRILNPNNGFYADYGGRGLEMEPEWADNFETWYADMHERLGDRPGPEYSIDRVNNDLGYVRANEFRWATPEEQANNRRVG